jgi:hypothetical protein
MLNNRHRIGRPRAPSVRLLPSPIKALGRDAVATCVSSAGCHGTPHKTLGRHAISVPLFYGNSLIWATFTRVSDGRRCWTMWHLSMAHFNVRPVSPAVVPTDALHACPVPPAIVPINALLLRTPVPLLLPLLRVLALLLVALLLIRCSPRSTMTTPAQGEALGLGAETLRPRLLLLLLLQVP